jgi:hypothetical protein
MSTETIDALTGIKTIQTNEIVTELVPEESVDRLVTSERVADQIFSTSNIILTGEMVITRQVLPTHENIIAAQENQAGVLNRIEAMRQKLYHVVNQYGRRDATFFLRSYASSGPYGNRNAPIATLVNVPMFVTSPMMDQTWVANAGADLNMPEQFELIIPYDKHIFDALYTKWKWQGNPSYRAYVKWDGRTYKLAYLAKHEVQGQVIYMHLVVQASINNWDFNDEGDLEANVPDLS